MNQMLPKTSVACSEKLRDSPNEPSCNGNSGSPENIVHKMHKNKLDVDVKLQDLDPEARDALRDLVSLVHDGLNATDQQSLCTTSDSGVDSNIACKNLVATKSNFLKDGNEQGQCSSADDSGIIQDKDCKVMSATELSNVKDDSIANIIWHLEPHALQMIFLAMAQNFPRTLEALILHLLSPVGAEVLTRKFDELDRQLTEEDRSTFYQRFYSVFDDHFAAMDAILNGKEAFALQAFKNVLQLYVGVTL